jgi:hypothetical protein
LSAGNNKTLFHVCKGEDKNSITIGCGIGNTTIDGNLHLANDTEISQFDCQYDQIIITKTKGLNVGKNIIIPYGTNLTNIGIGLKIEDIKTIIPYLGIDEYYILIDNYEIPFAKDEKFFQYYRKVYGGSLMEFGVLVRAYTDIAAINLLKINKYQNEIYIGCSEYSVTSSTSIRGNLQIQNTNGINITRNYNSVKLKVKDNNVSFENDNFPNTNMVLSNGFRTSVTNNEIVFHKPGDTITDNSSLNQLKLPFKTDLTNYNKPTFFQSILDHASINSPCNSLKETIITYQQYPTKELIGYFCTYESYSAILISVVNSPYYASPQLRIGIYESYGHLHKEYILTASDPKVVIDLTADLTTARSGQEIVSAQFATMGDTDEFYKACVNILSNIFISYTYEN